MLQESPQADLSSRILAALPVNVFVKDFQGGGLSYTNRALFNTLGYGDEWSDAALERVADLIHHEDLPVLQAQETQLRDGLDGSSATVEFRMKHVDGSWRWFAVRMSVFERDESGRAVSALGIAAEITETKENHEKLRVAATCDALTGLFNRRRFLEILEERIGLVEVPFALCMCDIDHFKKVNDFHGHAAGDEALSRFAQHLRRLVRKDDIVGRLGGDEFCILLPGVSAELSRDILDRVRRELESMVLGGPDDPFSVTASFGITDFKPGMNAAALFVEADKALYQAKRLGRNVVAVAPLAS